MDMRFSGMPRFLVGFALTRPASNDVTALPQPAALGAGRAIVVPESYLTARRRQADRRRYLRVVK